MLFLHPFVLWINIYIYFSIVFIVYEYLITFTLLGWILFIFFDPGLGVKQHKFDIAEFFYTECLKKRTSVLGALHPCTLQTICNITTVYTAQVIQTIMNRATIQYRHIYCVYFDLYLDWVFFLLFYLSMYLMLWIITDFITHTVCMFRENMT